MRLALVAIVKNEESCIQRMLNSVAAITDEQIVVDTGSSDATPELAAAAGARVFMYRWNDSFSDARNFALSLTKCPWRLFLDADEWLEDGADVLHDELTSGRKFRVLTVIDKWHRQCVAL